MMHEQTTNDQTKRLILDLTQEKKPENAKQLIALLYEYHAISPEKVTRLILELENEGYLHFTKSKISIDNSKKAYLLSKNFVWYWAIVVFAVATMITVFTIAESAFPVVYLRFILGSIFVLFLPGYTFLKLIFPNRPQSNSAFLTKGHTVVDNNNMDTIDRIALSIGLSIIFVSIAGLILNYTPWGIRLVPVTLSLLCLTIIFATTAVIHEYQKKLIIL